MPGPSEEQDEQFYRDTESAAFPKLDDYQLSLLEPLGQRRVLKRGDTIFKAGQRDFGLTILLRGELEAFEQRDDTEQILATARRAISSATCRCCRARPLLPAFGSRQTRAKFFMCRRRNSAARWRKFPVLAQQSSTH